MNEKALQKLVEDFHWKRFQESEKGFWEYWHDEFSRETKTKPGSLARILHCLHIT